MFQVCTRSKEHNWLCHLFVIHSAISHETYFPMIRQNKEPFLFWTTKNDQNMLFMIFSAIMGISIRDLGFIYRVWFQKVCGFFRIVSQFLIKVSNLTYAAIFRVWLSLIDSVLAFYWFEKGRFLCFAWSWRKRVYTHDPIFTLSLALMIQCFPATINTLFAFSVVNNHIAFEVPL